MQYSGVSFNADWLPETGDLSQIKINWPPHIQNYLDNNHLEAELIRDETHQAMIRLTPAIPMSQRRYEKVTERVQNMLLRSRIKRG